MIVISQQHQILSQIVDKIVSLLQQNTNVQLISKISNITYDNDTLSLQNIIPKTILCLNDQEYKQQTKQIQNIYTQNFYQQVEVNDDIIRVQMDFPFIVISQKSEIGSNYNIRVQYTMGNIVVKQQLAWFVKAYIDQQIEYQVDNVYQDQIMKIFDVNIMNFSKICNAITNLLAQPYVDQTIMKAACVFGVIFSKNVYKQEEIESLIAIIDKW
ncbi:Hypothetical_protein [Hexamita inflata]|nr:Hypothetical protein HINF_LOCUS9272 [Hexamita inflata]CAI9950229.1 Hypothetical protein HINF_LOCUS37874 [Hexamita inflata]